MKFSDVSEDDCPQHVNRESELFGLAVVFSLAVIGAGIAFYFSPVFTRRTCGATRSAHLEKKERYEIIQQAVVEHAQKKTAPEEQERSNEK